MVANKYNEDYVYTIKKLITENVMNEIYRKYVVLAFELIIKLNLIKYFDQYEPNDNTGYLYTIDKYMLQIIFEIDKETEYKLSNIKIGFILRTLKNTMNKVN